MVNDRHTARFRRIKEEVSDRVIVMGVRCSVLSRGSQRVDGGPALEHDLSCSRARSRAMTIALLLGAHIEQRLARHRRVGR